MSLNPEDLRRRGRSKSPGGRERSRSRVDERERERSRVRVPSPPSRYEDNRDRDYEYEERTTVKTSRGDRDRDRDRDDLRYDDYRTDSPPRRPHYAVPGEYKHSEIDEEVKLRYGGGREKEYNGRKSSKRDDDYERERHSYYEADPRERDSRRHEEDRHGRDRGGSYNVSGGISISHGHGRDESPRRKQPESPPRRKHSESPRRRTDSESPPRRKHSESPPYESSYKGANVVTAGGHSRYAEPKRYEYAQVEENIKYIRKDSYTSKPPEKTYTSSRPTQIVTVEPGRRRPSGGDSLGPRMSSLSVSGGPAPAMSLALVPGSPLLEAYHGTYQSISPMPSPLMIASSAHNHDIDVLDIGHVSPISTKRRRARFNDLPADAAALALALRGSKAPDTEPLIEILPALTHEQILALRAEYKRIVKTGSDKKGVNIAKHIKMRLKDEDSSLMKACYTTALGRWESEAYWANFWYQGEKSRRELLIESLMGRTNSEIRAIKDGFHDKKYSDSLTKCMKQELKEDKFKKAILLVLEERRMEERPGYSLDRLLVEDDVRELHKAVKSEKGGESTMIGIIVLRSDSHLREILKIYEATYRANFTREMLKKSGNLVGELLAHILNGVINRPVRDALLLNHALTLTKSDSLRTELLVSRLVRYHWDRPHMEAIKREYRSRYGKELQQAVDDGSKGNWGEFCVELCVRRMGDEVRRVERVERIDPDGFRLG